MSTTMDKFKQIMIPLVPVGAVVKIECMGETETVGEHGSGPTPAVDLRAILSKLLNEVPPGVMINLTLIEPRPPIEDGFCTGCGQPAQRLPVCPRGDKCGIVFCDCSPCQRENDWDEGLFEDEDGP